MCICTICNLNFNDEVNFNKHMVETHGAVMGKAYGGTGGSGGSGFIATYDSTSTKEEIAAKEARYREQKAAQEEAVRKYKEEERLRKLKKRRERIATAVLAGSDVTRGGFIYEGDFITRSLEIADALIKELDK